MLSIRTAQSEHIIYTNNVSSDLLFVKTILTPPAEVPLTYVERAKQDACWDSLIWRESSWRVDAINKISGAYGLPQSLPASKLAEAGEDWKTNPETQLKWMEVYVQKKYGDFCTALRFHDKMNWY